MLKKILILSIFYLLNTNLYAQDLLKTLSDAFKNNSKLTNDKEIIANISLFHQKLINPTETQQK